MSPYWSLPLVLHRGQQRPADFLQQVMEINWEPEPRTGHESRARIIMKWYQTMQRICTRTAECTLCKQWYWNWESRMGYQVKMDKEKLSFFTNIQTYRYRSWQPRPDRPAPDLRGEVLGCVTYCSIRRHIRPSCWTRPGAGDAATGETVSWDEATWRLAAAGQGTRYHANYPDYKTCPRHHICS